MDIQTQLSLIQSQPNNATAATQGKARAAPGGGSAGIPSLLMS